MEFCTPNTHMHWCRIHRAQELWEVEKNSNSNLYRLPGYLESCWGFSLNLLTASFNQNCRVMIFYNYCTNCWATQNRFIQAALIPKHVSVYNIYIYIYNLHYVFLFILSIFRMGYLQTEENILLMHVGSSLHTWDHHMGYKIIITFNFFLNISRFAKQFLRNIEHEATCATPLIQFIPVCMGNNKVK